MAQTDSPPGDPARIFARGGENGRRMRAIDWSTSPLGPVADWPDELRSAVSLLLPSSAQIMLFWGPDYIGLYNDAHITVMGAKHPHALGQRACDIWAEAWDELRPLLDHVRETGETYAAKDRRFVIERMGFSEEVFFDVSYSPVPSRDGSVGGVLCIVSETTERVQKVRAGTAENERLRAMFDHAPGFIAVLREPGHVFELANATYRRLTGNRALVGRRYAEALPEVAAQGFIDRLDEVVRTGKPFVGNGVPVRLPTAVPGQTEARWIDFICQPITNDQRQVTAIFIEGIDHTDRYRAEQALAESRDALAQATDAGEIAIWDCDLLRDRLTCSSRGLDMYGLSRDVASMTTAEFLALLHPDDLPSVRAAFAAAIDPATRAGYDVEYQLALPIDGDIRWLAARGRGIFAGDTCLRVTGTVIDITPRKREEEARRESESRFRRLADSLPALVWLTDAEGRITFASEGFDTILGEDPKRIVEEGWVGLLRPDRRAEATAARREWIGRPTRVSGDYPLINGHGDERWFHVEGRPRYSGTTFVGYVTCAIDVTEAHVAGERLEARVAERTAELTRQIAERERVEETLHQMQRLEAIGQLTSGVAHDFNNLLTVVLGNVDALSLAAERGAIDRRLLVRLDHIRLAAERGATLTGQMLAFARRQRLEAEVVDLNTTVARLSPLLASTLGGSIAVVSELGDPIWPALVDPTQIELILLNLAINARDAMPGGGTLTVSTRNVTRAAPDRPEEPPAGDYVCVAVSDTGSGMSDAVLMHVFEPFFTTKEVGKGSGLGLAQVFGFAKQSGGGVRIDSAPGTGTAVSVFLPRAATVAMPAPTPTPAGVGMGVVPPAVEAPAHAAAAMAGRTILLLDDEDRVRAVAADTLREAGCRVIEACDGAAGLEALAHEPRVDVVVADVAMPVMTGMEFAQHLAGSHPRLPILFVTGNVELCEMHGVPEERLLRKPYPRRLLLERVRALLA